jgi:hypothetical protein
MTRVLAVLIPIALAGAASASAQTPTVDGVYGRAWFVDDAAIPHHTLAAAVQVPVTAKLSIGPEVSFLIGPGSDRDLIATGNVTYAFRPTGVSPFVVAGGGLFRHSDRFGAATFTSTEGAFTTGGGVRVPIAPRWFVAPEARVGWELHTLVQVRCGARL